MSSWMPRASSFHVNVSSGTARPASGPPFATGSAGATLTVYGASKAALNRITNGLGDELHGAGVRVNTIEPRAAVLTEGADALVGGTLRPDQIESLEEMVEDIEGGADVQDTLAAWMVENAHINIYDDELPEADEDGAAAGDSADSAGVR